MPRNPKVSVVIPIYKVEAYLAKCLDSVINQTYRNLEIICVDDCSPDGCAKIVADYAARDERISLIGHEKNRGLSAARNTGFDSATGDYVYFIDSDDWIDLDYIEKMVAAAFQNNAKVVLNTKGLWHVDDKTLAYAPNNTRDDIENVFVNPREVSGKIIWNTWAHLWEKSFLQEHNLRFPEGYVNEDLFFQLASYACLDRVYVIRNSVYHYFQRSTSITQTKDTNDFERYASRVDIWKQIFLFYTERDLLKENDLRLMNEILFPPMVDISVRKKMIEYVRDYFVLIAEYVKCSRVDYSNSEKQFFEDVLSDSAKSLATNYVGKSIVEMLRRKRR